jgi:hypothetical protein
MYAWAASRGDMLALSYCADAGRVTADWGSGLCSVQRERLSAHMRGEVSTACFQVEPSRLTLALVRAPKSLNWGERLGCGLGPGPLRNLDFRVTSSVWYPCFSRKVIGISCGGELVYVRCHKIAFVG